MNLIRNIVCLIAVLILGGCGKEFLELEPQDKVDTKTLFSDPAGLELYMVNLYSQMPLEDFQYTHYKFGDYQNQQGWDTEQHIDDAVHSQWSFDVINGSVEWWTEGYKLSRDVNLLIEAIPVLNLSDADKKILLGECSFIRAYCYFGMVKRYGGVPIIKNVQDYTPDVEQLKVPRSTEKETWDFVLSECDIAIANLPILVAGTPRRANKFVAFALKSRVALHAASIAKFWNKAPLSGEAFDKGLVGINASEANTYYTACIAASDSIMKSGKFNLYKPAPANPAEAAENYRDMFENPGNASVEAIFTKGYALAGSGHSYDFWYHPNQGDPRQFPGRMNPTLELADQYESYTNPGSSAPIITTTDGNINDYNGFDKNKPYIRFNTPNEIFKDKDARMWGTIVLPGTTWKGKTIVIQGGYVQPDGVAKILTSANITVNGVKYYTYGAADWSGYSGFDSYGYRMTRSGFSFKKFLNSKVDVPGGYGQSLNDWMDIRYTEILLNFAEAVVESGYTDNNATTKAAKAINDIRRRAGHTVNIPLTLNNVMRERRVELAFEHKRYWDLMRRRDYHILYNNYIPHALIPLLDLRVNPPQYIFVRQLVPGLPAQTLETKRYYRAIPGVATNGLVQNPQY